MDKREAVEIFGNQTRLGEAVGLTRSAISQWPDVLPQRYADMVIGAALRLGGEMADRAMSIVERDSREAA